MVNVAIVAQSRNSLPISTPTEIVKVRWVDVILNRNPGNYLTWKQRRDDINGKC